MAIDPIVAEVRAAREAIARECNFDIRLITQRARERQRTSGREIASFAPAPVGTGPITERTHTGGDDNVIDAEFEKK